MNTITPIRTSKEPGPTLTVPALAISTGHYGWTAPKDYALTVRVVRQGDRYGRDDCLIHDGRDEDAESPGPMVAFSLTEDDRDFGYSDGWMIYSLDMIDGTAETWERDADEPLGIGQDGGTTRLYITGEVRAQVVRWARTNMA